MIMGRRRGMRHSPPALLVYLGLFVAIQWNLAAAAWADGGPNVGALSAFDVADSKGIDVSRYAMALDPGMDPTRAMLVAIMSLSWDCYRWTLATLAVVLDWTTDMGWVPMISGPISDAVTYLKTSLLGPIGATGFSQGGLIALLLMISALVGGFAVIRGRSGGWMTMVESMAAAVLVIGFLASPVVLLAGDDVQASRALRYVQRTAVQLSTTLTTGEAPEGLITDPPAKKESKPGSMVPDAGDVSPDYGKTKHGTIIIDSFVTPVHQVLNYGEVLDSKCTPVYEKALREAKSSADLQKVREKIGDSSECDDKYKAYADDFSWGRLFAMFFFQSTGWGMGLFLLVFMLLLFRSVARLVWTGVMIIFHGLWAMAPGPTKAPLLRDMINAAIELVYVVTSTVVLGLVMATIKKTFVGANGDIVARFLVVLMLLLLGVGLLIANLIAHLKVGKSLAQILSTRLRQKVPGKSIGERVGGWAAAGAGAGIGGGIGGGALAGAGASGMAAGGMRRVMNSNGGRLAMGAAQLAAGAASGGTSLALKSAVTAGKTMRRAGTFYSSFRAGQGGMRGGHTTGSRLADGAINAVANRHNRIADRVDETKSYYRSQRTGAVRGGAQTSGSEIGDRLLGGVARGQRRMSNLLHRRADQPDLKMDPRQRDLITAMNVEQRKKNKPVPVRPELDTTRDFLAGEKQMRRDTAEQRKVNTAQAKFRAEGERQARKEASSPLAKAMAEAHRRRHGAKAGDEGADGDGDGPTMPSHARWTRHTSPGKGES